MNEDLKWSNYDFTKIPFDDIVSFGQRIKTDVREITPADRVELSEAVKIWDFNNKERKIC